MEQEFGQIIANPVVASYLFNTFGSMVDIVSTAVLHSRNGNPDELNRNLHDAMNERGPAGGGCLGEIYRRVGFGAVTIGLLGVDKFVVPFFSETPLHLTETALVGMGLVYLGAAFLNFASLGIRGQD